MTVPESFHPSIVRSPKVVEVRQLFKKFGGKNVLNGFDLEMFEGECLVVIGRSGAGKTVMIRCLVGLMTGDAEKVEVLNKNIPDLEQSELDELRSDIGFLFQGSALYDSMSVRENLEFPMRRHRDRFDAAIDSEKLVLEALASVGLEHTIDLMPSELSGGMKRRVALARTLILKPKIILYDEPTTGLDPITSKEIIALMLEVQQKYKNSSLIITHDMDVARLIANRVVVLIDGRSYAVGTYGELSKSDDPVLRAFFK